MAARIRKGDTVEVITGADKGRRGEVLRVFPRAERAIVAGIRMVTKHQKETGFGKPAGLIHEEASIHLSNVMLVDPKTEQKTKVGFRVLDDGRKVRVAKATNQVIEG